MSAQDDRARHTHMLQGLVGYDLESLYYTNASFKASIDTLANMLPSMVAGLAVECENQERQTRATEQMLRQMPPVIPAAFRTMCDFADCRFTRTSKVLALNIDDLMIVPCDYHLEVITNMRRDVDYRIDREGRGLRLSPIPAVERPPFPVAPDG